MQPTLASSEDAPLEGDRASGDKRRTNLSWWASVFFVYVLPVAAINSGIVPVWLGRTIAISSFTFFVTVAIFWFGLNPKTKMIRGGRYAAPDFAKFRRRTEIEIRIVVVAFGIFFAYSDATPLASDILHLCAGEKPAAFKAEVTYRTTALFGGALLGENSVRLASTNGSYYLFYNWTKQIKVGRSYEFVVLPRSRTILDLDEVKQAPLNPSDR